MTETAVSHEQFLARRCIELEEEVRRQTERIKLLAHVIAELSAGPVVEVSAEQFSLLAYEGTQQ